VLNKVSEISTFTTKLKQVQAGFGYSEETATIDSFLGDEWVFSTEGSIFSPTAGLVAVKSIIRLTEYLESVIHSK
jgi:hypothetical protein